MLALAFNLLGWYSCNSFFNVLNKQALNLFPYPWVVAWLQLFAGVALIAPAWLAGLRTAPRVDAQFLGANFLPMGLLHSTGHAAQVFSFGAGSVFMAHVIKALEPIIGTVIGVVFLGSRPSLATNASLAPIVGGVVHAAMKPGPTRHAHEQHVRSA